MSNAQTTVLIIEDDKSISDTLVDVLHAGEGFNVIQASNGKEALEMLRASPQLPNVILLDLMMPVMDGKSFRQEQRNDPSLAAIPVILMSAERDLSSKISELGVHAIISKPFDLDKLIEVISGIGF